MHELPLSWGWFLFLVTGHTSWQELSQAEGGHGHVCTDSAMAAVLPLSEHRSGMTGDWSWETPADMHVRQATWSKHAAGESHSQLLTHMASAHDPHLCCTGTHLSKVHLCRSSNGRELNPVQGQQTVMMDGTRIHYSSAHAALNSYKKGHFDLEGLRQLELTKLADEGLIPCVQHNNEPLQHQRWWSVYECSAVSHTWWTDTFGMLAAKVNTCHLDHLLHERSET